MGLISKIYDKYRDICDKTSDKIDDIMYGPDVFITNNSYLSNLPKSDDKDDLTLAIEYAIKSGI